MAKKFKARARRGTAGGRVKQTTATAPPVSVVNLARALAALARGLPNTADESADYFHRFMAPLPAGTALDSSACVR